MVGVHLLMAVYHMKEDDILELDLEQFLEKINHLQNIAKFNLLGEISFIDNKSIENKYDAEYELLKSQGF